MYTFMITTNDYDSIVSLLNQNHNVEKIYITGVNCDFNAEQLNNLPKLREIQIVNSHNIGNALKVLIQKSEYLEVIDVDSQDWLEDGHMQEEDVAKVTTLKTLRIKKSPSDQHYFIKPENKILAKLIQNNAATIQSLECEWPSGNYLGITPLNRLTNLKLLLVEGIYEQKAEIMKNISMTIETLDASGFLLKDESSDDDAGKLQTLHGVKFPQLKIIYSNRTNDEQALIMLLNASEPEELDLGYCFDLYLEPSISINKLTKVKKFSAHSIPEQTLSILLEDVHELEELKLEYCSKLDIQTLQKSSLSKVKKFESNDFNCQQLSILLKSCASSIETLGIIPKDLFIDSDAESLHGIKFPKLREIKFSFNMSGAFLATIIVKAPLLHSNTKLLIECLGHFIIYHKSIGTIANLLIGRLTAGEKISEYMMEKICKNEYLPHTRKCMLLQAWFNKIGDKNIQKILDNPQKYSEINAIINIAWNRHKELDQKAAKILFSETNSQGQSTFRQNLINTPIANYFNQQEQRDNSSIGRFDRESKQSKKQPGV